MLIDIEGFYKKFGFKRAPKPTSLADIEGGTERLRHLKEELTELAQATADGDVARQADALVDIVWVALGTAWMMGLPWRPIWSAVQRANMRKVLVDTPKRVGKPEGWVGPENEIRSSIQNYRWLSWQ